MIIDELLVFLVGSVNWLSGVLPADPFGSYLDASAESLSLGIGWLNWCVPVTECSAILAAFVAALSARRVGSAVYGVGRRVLGLLSGGVS